MDTNENQHKNFGKNVIISKVFDVYAALNDERKVHDVGGSGEPMSESNSDAIDEERQWISACHAGGIDKITRS